MAAQGPGRIVRAISVGITQAPVAPEEARRHAACLSSLRGTFIGAGLTGSLIGLVSMLQTLDDPSKIGPAAAVMILTVFYGVILSELIVNPMRHAVLRIAHGPD